MAARSAMDIYAALVAGKQREILGCPEGRDIDFKRDPYQLNTRKGKWELAKDVAAFANAGGGLIVIGVKTERLEGQLSEVASELNPVRKDTVDLRQYREAIANGLTPAVEDIRIVWLPESDDEDGTLVISVPTQQETLKPFVLRRIVDSDGIEVFAFAIPRRNEDRTDWTSAEHIQSQLALLPLLRASVPSAFKGATGPNIDDRIVDIIRELGVGEEPCLALQITPPVPVDLSADFFGHNGVAGHLRMWSGLRDMGFDLASNQDPEPRGTALMFGGSRWRARVGVDGTLDLVLPVRFDFLCWAMDRQGRNTILRINPVPLVEVTYDFFRLANAIAIRRGPLGAWRICVRAWRMRAGGVELRAGLPNRFIDEGHQATSDDYVPTAFSASEQPAVDAFQALVRIYGLWGLGAEAIPFTKGGEVVPESIGSGKWGR